MKFKVGIFVLVGTTFLPLAALQAQTRSVLKRHPAQGHTQLAGMRVNFYSENRAKGCCEAPPSCGAPLLESCGCESAPTCEAPACGCEVPACGCEVPACGCEVPACGCDSPACGSVKYKCCMPILPAIAADVKQFLGRLTACGCRHRCGRCDRTCDTACDAPACGCETGLQPLDPFQDDPGPPPTPAATRPPELIPPTARPASAPRRLSSQDLQARLVYPMTPSKAYQARYSQSGYASSTTTSQADAWRGYSGAVDSSVRAAEALRSERSYPANPLR